MSTDQGVHGHHIGARGRRRSSGHRGSSIFNFGVIGRSNSGKSSFIKAMFHSRFGPDCDINPKTDFVESTMECQRYHYPGSPVALWDVPGCGTVKVPSDDYALKINMDMYDGFIICCSTVLSEYELALHNLIATKGKRHIFVRTNVETALFSEKQAHPQTFNRESTLKTLNDKIESQLGGTGAPIYLVDNHNPQEFDFPNLCYLIFEGDLSSFMRHASARRRRLRSDKK